MIFRWIVLSVLSLTVVGCSGFQNSAERFVAQESKRLIEQIRLEQYQSERRTTKPLKVVDVNLFPQQIHHVSQGLALRSP